MTIKKCYLKILASPIDIRKKLGVKEGDKILFFEERGRILMANSSMMALENAQKEFAGEAERLGLRNEQDVVDMISELRRERYAENHA